MNEIPIDFIIANLTEKGVEDIQIKWQIYKYVNNSDIKEKAYNELSSKAFVLIDKKGYNVKRFVSKRNIKRIYIQACNNII